MPIQWVCGIIMQFHNLFADMYMEDVRCGHCEKEGEPEIIKEKAATAWVDGKNLLGTNTQNLCIALQFVVLIFKESAPRVSDSFIE